MDDPTILWLSGRTGRLRYGDPVSIGEGFPGERLRILPPAVARAASTSPITRELLVTDAGWFPHALHHGRQRLLGAGASVVIVCTAGRGWCRATEDDTAPTLHVRAGQALVLPAQLGHRYGSMADDPWTIIWMHAAGPQARAFEASLPGDGRRPVVIDLHDRARIQQLMEEVLTTMEVDDTLPSLMRTSGAAGNVLAHLAADAAAGPPLRQAPLRRVFAHLRDHLDQPVVVSELAGLSPSHFAALFRAATGGGVVAYVTRLRIARASELLATTTLPVAEVGRIVGYEDPLYFSRRFRGIQGTSPRMFREAHLHDPPEHVPRDAWPSRHPAD